MSTIKFLSREDAIFVMSNFTHGKITMRKSVQNVNNTININCISIP